MPFSPADLFTTGDVGIWLDPSDTSTLFQDTGGTTPVVADGDIVARINDKSPNGLDFVQATISKRPIYRTDGTLHWLEFDGVNDDLGSLVVQPLGAPIENVSLIFGMRETSRKASALFSASPSNVSASTRRLLAHVPWSDGNIYFDALLSGRITAATPVAVSNDFVAAFINSVADSKRETRVDGIQLAFSPTGNSVEGSGEIFKIGAHDNIFAAFRLYGCVIKIGSLSTSQLEATENWAAEKSGLVTPADPIAPTGIRQPAPQIPTATVTAATTVQPTGIRQVAPRIPQGALTATTTLQPDGITQPAPKIPQGGLTASTTLAPVGIRQPGPLIPQTDVGSGVSFAPVGIRQPAPQVPRATLTATTTLVPIGIRQPAPRIPQAEVTAATTLNPTGIRMPGPRLTLPAPIAPVVTIGTIIHAVAVRGPKVMQATATRGPKIIHATARRDV